MLVLTPEETKNTVVLNGDTDGDLRAVSTLDEDAAGTAAKAPPVDESVFLDFAETSSGELGELTRRMITALSYRADEKAFAELLGLYESLGTAMGESARTLAQHGSWSRVAGMAGVSRQTAWYRWRE